MKKKSLIVGGIAAFAAIASIGTSFALYKVAPENKEVNIGIRTGTDINYAISEVEQRMQFYMFNDILLYGEETNGKLYIRDYFYFGSCGK